MAMTEMHFALPGWRLEIVKANNRQLRREKKKLKKIWTDFRCWILFSRFIIYKMPGNMFLNRHNNHNIADVDFVRCNRRLIIIGSDFLGNLILKWN